jgi:putative iron-dependent peroxidase
VATFQPGILAQGTRFHHHLEFDLRDGVSDTGVRDALSGLREPAATVGGSNLVIGFGAALWRRLAHGLDEVVPASLRIFEPIVGAGGRGVPSTPHDVWVWIHGAGPDMVLDTARAVGATLAGVATLAAEQPCFAYRDSRDMTGFIDGTENPPVAEASEVAFIPDAGAGVGGSHAIVMRWVHDLAAFHALGLREQEGVFGRTKADSVELDDDVKPPTAHIARVVVEDEEGEELEIYRRSVPFGTVTEQGLLFVAFSRDPSRFDVMLARMFGTSGDNVHDQLIEFSQPVTAATYFAPSLEAIASLLT